MLAPSHLEILEGTAPCAGPDRSPLTRPGLWYELLRYRPCAENESERSPEPCESAAPESPRQAIRALRGSVRDWAARMPPRDRYAILTALDDHSDNGLSGDVQAVAALYQGLPVGFAHTAQNGDHLEWAVRPVLFLALV
ncbi:hypothetical protein GCM10010232_64160 [Streptomyces amakusaensis]|uniref:Uncharacterized protein n=1 Tax=Streptomyces amakusaensis TaxID=67271 RepID=A0ABW0AQV2_9ACTN